MAKKDLSTLLMELKSDKEIKISEYSKEDILNAVIHLANSKDLSRYSNDEISKEFYKFLNSVRFQIRIRARALRQKMGTVRTVTLLVSFVFDEAFLT